MNTYIQNGSRIHGGFWPSLNYLIRPSDPWSLKYLNNQQKKYFIWFNRKCMTRLFIQAIRSSPKNFKITNICLHYYKAHRELFYLDFFCQASVSHILCSIYCFLPHIYRFDWDGDVKMATSLFNDSSVFKGLRSSRLPCYEENRVVIYVQCNILWFLFLFHCLRKFLIQPHFLS